MNSEIISVGSELLSGKQVNTNAQFISSQLKSIGIDVVRQSAVQDDKNEIKRLVSEALGRCNVVILTGGLGPTPDDITKDAVCELLNIKMVVDEPSLDKIESHFFRKGEKMADNNIRQAMIPEGSLIIKNDLGLSPGCILKSGSQCIILLPGPPYEMKPMFEKTVRPFLRNMNGSNVVSKTVNVFGMSESLIAESLSDIIAKDLPQVATYADFGQTDVFVSAKADDIKEAIGMVDKTVEEIERRLGDAVYGVDETSLHSAVVSELISRKITVATAESCTGGLISKKITDIPGASEIFGLGVTSYSQEAKNTVLGVSSVTLDENGAVSAETACQMAVGAMNRSGADMGVSVTGYAGPATSLAEPVGLVFIAVCNSETVWVKRFEISANSKDSRDKIRELASRHAFDMLRRVVGGMAIFNSQRIPVSEIANSISEIEANRSKVLFRAKETKQSEKTPVPERQFENNFKGKLKKFAYNMLPNRDDQTSEKVRKSVFLTASVALIVSICYILSFFMGISQNKTLYNNLEKLKNEKPSANTNYPAGYLEKFGLLYEKNPDIAGWVQIEGTQINYPVVQGRDNDYYLTHNFNGKKERHGVPFMDYRNGIKTLNVNTVLHGHNMKSDNQMFAELKYYYKGKDALNFYRQHPIIKFDTVYKEMEWKIFAVFTANTNPSNGDVFPYYEFIAPETIDEFNDFMWEVRNRSIFNIPVDVEITDRILTLSTCYYEYNGQRLVVMARKLRDGESNKVDVNAVTYNRGNENVSSKNSNNNSTIVSRNSSKESSSNRRPVGYSSYKAPSYTIYSGPTSNNSSKTSSTVTSSDVSTSSDTSTSDTSTSSKEEVSSDEQDVSSDNSSAQSDVSSKAEGAESSSETEQSSSQNDGGESSQSDNE